jgi:exodeoxyribonuclease-3
MLSIYCYQEYTLKIISLNLNGIRSATNKGLYAWLKKQDADVICMQEIKAQVTDMTTEMLNPEGDFGYFHYAQKKGYSGVGIYTRKQPDEVIEGLSNCKLDDTNCMKDIDSEGRYIEARFGNLSGVSLYLPSGSSGEERQAFKFSVMERFLPQLKALKASGRDVVICGDWNIAHKEIDSHDPKGNKKSSGFLPEEREMLATLKGWGLIDTFRALHPQATEKYSWFDYRSDYANSLTGHPGIHPPSGGNAGWNLEVTSL